MTDYAAALRGALLEAGYTYDGVAGLLGPLAHSALGRNETTPGLRATADGSPLATLTRLWPLQAPVALAEAERALPGLVDRLCAEGVLERSVGEVAARLDCRPYAADDRDLWVVSDLTPGLDGAPNRVGAEHVLGISAASTSLAQLTVREPLARALDLGTGCGVQALHLAAHASSVTATDVNERALAMSRLNAALNEVDLDVRAGSFFEPVAGERFDLVVTNPPFVISPGTGERLVYRDSGMPGDRVVEHIVRTAPRHLSENGWCQVLANWVIPRGGQWQERVSGWFDGSECDGWVVQREVADPAAYVELWLKDAGLHGGAHYRERYDTWLAWFEENGVEGVGFGWLALRRTGRESPTVRLEEWPWDVEQPLGVEIADWGRRCDLLAGLDDDRLMRLHPTLREDVQQETTGPAGAEDPTTIVIRQQRQLRRARQVDTAEAALVGALDGDLSVGQVVAALAQLLEEPETALRERLLPVVRELLGDGFLTYSRA